MAKILLTDDAMFMRLTLKKILTQAGYTDITEASNGQEAVEKYKNECPDIVFMDITMPTKTGLEAVKEIIEYDPNAKIIMCSAMGQQSMVLEAIKHGAKDFIVKPFHEKRVLESLHKILNI